MAEFLPPHVGGYNCRRCLRAWRFGTAKFRIGLKRCNGQLDDNLEALECVFTHYPEPRAMWVWFLGSH